ncbi:MAG: hypothetical protein ACOCWR_00680 [Oceanidesulfovibrio sp.]
MSIVQRFEDFGVEVAFAEANAWHACPTKSEPPNKEKPMSTTMTHKRKRARARAVLFGMASVGLYAAVFTHADVVTELFSKGGVNAFLPVATVFLVSYVHGSFASNVWSALGIEGSNKKAVRKEAPAEKRPHASSRPRVHA